MATCARETGLLLWKKRCDAPSIGPCDQCRLFICHQHGNIQGDGGLLCNRCANTEDEDSGGSWISSSSDGDASFSSDSSASSDSGGGGDGGSGGD